MARADVPDEIGLISRCCSCGYDQHEVAGKYLYKLYVDGSRGASVNAVAHEPLFAPRNTPKLKSGGRRAAASVARAPALGLCATGVLALVVLYGAGRVGSLVGGWEAAVPRYKMRLLQLLNPQFRQARSRPVDGRRNVRHRGSGSPVLRFARCARDAL